MVGANAYLGADAILPALAAGADVVITGRVADPSLFLAPLRHAFGWAADDWTALGAGTLVGHLMECAAQITGGYFADPGYKEVPDLARVGFPIAEVSADGGAVITKLADAGGLVSERTVKEQVLYEVHDPAALRHARRGGRLQRRAHPRAGQGSGRRERRRRRAAAGAAQGHGRVRWRPAGRGRDLLRRAGRCRAGRARAPDRPRAHGRPARLQRAAPARPRRHRRAARDRPTRGSPRRPGRPPARGAARRLARDRPSCCCGRWNRCSAAARPAAAAIAARSPLR